MMSRSEFEGATGHSALHDRTADLPIFGHWGRVNPLSTARGEVQ